MTITMVHKCISPWGAPHGVPFRILGTSQDVRLRATFAAMDSGGIQGSRLAVLDAGLRGTVGPWDGHQTRVVPPSDVNVG